MTIGFDQLVALFKGIGEPTVLAEIGFAYQLQPPRGTGYLLVPALHTGIPARIEDSANNSITGDLSVEWVGVLGTYTSVVNGAQGLVIKSIGSTGQVSYTFVILNGGTLRLVWSPNGTPGSAVVAVSTVSLSTVVNPGYLVGLRAELDVDDGAGGWVVRFYYSLDNGDTWIQLGGNVTGAGVTSVFDGTADLCINGQNNSGATVQYMAQTIVRRAAVYSGIGGAKVVKQDFNPNNAAVGSTTVPDGVTGAWTIGPDATLVGFRVPQGFIYFSDDDYCTGPADVPPSTVYRNAIDVVPSIERGVDLNSLGGRGTVSVDSLVLNNADGALDYMLDLIIDGQEATLYVGERTWAKADFVAIGVGTVASVTGSEKQITLRLTNKNALLDATIVGDPIPVGPNAGKPKPIILGAVSNLDLTPYLLDAGTLKYIFNHRGIDNYDDAHAGLYPYDPKWVWDVRDSGVTLIKTPATGNVSAVAATDLFSRTGHGLAVDDVVIFGTTGVFPAGVTPNKQYWILASGLTANDWKMSDTRGGTPVDVTVDFPATAQVVLVRRYFVDAQAATITLSSTPAGRVTCDLRGLLLDPSHGGPAYGQTMDSPYQGFRYVMDNFTRLTSADRDDATFAAVETVMASLAGLWGQPVLDRTNVQDILDGIVQISNGWYSSDYRGRIIVGRLDLQNLDSVQAIDTITEQDIQGDPTWENLAIPFGKMIVSGGANASVQTDGIAASVTATNRNIWGQPFWVQKKTTDQGDISYKNWWLYHKTAIDSKPVNLPLTIFNFGGAPNTAIVQTICDERTALFKPWTRVMRCTVGMDKYTLNPGDPIAVKYPRYGLDAGKNFRVASIRTRPADLTCELVLVRQSTPDFLTSRHDV